MTTPCRICGGDAAEAFRALVLERHPARYRRCGSCGFLWIEAPAWLEDAYAEAISAKDFGIMRRNLRNARIASALIACLFDRAGPFVDFGGGLGLFTRLMRDLGYDFRWHDPYARNLVARGHEADLSRPQVLATAFETLEHLVDPVGETAALLASADSLFLSTELLPSPLPRPGEWAYYGLDHGQHVSFHTVRSLRLLAGRLGLRAYSDGRTYHLLTPRRLSGAAYALLIRAAKRAPLGLFRNRGASAVDDYAPAEPMKKAAYRR